MSKAMANKIKKWYPRLWKLDQVRNAVKKGVITEDEYKDITGMDYNTSEIKDDTPNEVKEETSTTEVSSTKEE